MEKYKGLGKEGMSFNEAMELLKKTLAELDPYVLNVLFDILFEEEDESNTHTTGIHNRSPKDFLL